MKRIYYLFFLLACFLCGCEKNIKTGENSQAIILCSTKVKKLDPSKSILDKEDAIILSNLFINSSEIQTRTVHPEISKISSIDGDDRTPLAFIINYSGNQGYVVVSARKTYVPIIAFSDTGQLTLEELSNTGAGILIGEQVFF